MKVKKALVTAAIGYAAGGALTTLFWGYKAGSIPTAITGSPGQAANIFITWPVWLFNFFDSGGSL